MSQFRFASAALLLLGGALAPAALGAQATEPVGPDTVVYTSRGRVVFLHNKHGDTFACASCHHEDKPEMPFARPRQKCSDCHTEPPKAPATTSLRDSMHDTDARTGLCFDCHTTEGAKGAKVPVLCVNCHTRASGGSTHPEPGRLR